MERLLMIDRKIDELFDAIESSKEYISYLYIGKVLEQDKEVNNLVNEIKILQQKSVRLEEEGDLEYKNVDKVIEEKVSILNNKPIYKEYLRRMNEFNDTLAQSSNAIESYINEKV